MNRWQQIARDTVGADYAEQYVCGDEFCSGGTEDRDEDGIGDWVEFVICGDRWCANGSEDYDADGI